MIRCKDIVTVRLIFSLLAVLLCSSSLTSQHNLINDPVSQVKFSHLSEDAGISKVITWVHADSEGFIWAGTGTAGLYRYDGYEFKSYQYSHDDTTTISDNYVTGFRYEDASGNLWVTFFTGELNRYNRDTDDFTRFRLNSEEASEISDRVSSVTGDESGNVWIGTYSATGDEQAGGLYLCDGSTDKIFTYRNDPDNPESLTDNQVSRLLMDSSGTLWIGTVSGVVDRFVPGNNGRDDRFIHYREVPGDPEIPFISVITAMAEDLNGTIWIGTGGQGILRYLREEDRFIRYLIHDDPSSPSNHINTLSPGPDGRLWIGTNEGLAVWDPGKDLITLYRHQPADPFSIPRGRVLQLAHSADGMVWMEMVTGSIQLSDGLVCFDPSSEHFFTFRKDPRDPNSLSSNVINDLFADQNGILWIGTMDGGVNIYDPFKRKFGLLQSNPLLIDGMPPGKIYSMIEDSNGILWIGTMDAGLFRYERSSGKITNFAHNPDDPHSINNNTVLTICEHPEGTLWLGGYGGLKSLDTETMRFRHFAYDPENPAFQRAGQIMYIIADREGILWMGTLGAGLIRFVPETGQFTPFIKDRSSHGGPDLPDAIISISEGSDGSLWLSTFNGLYRYMRGKGEDSDTLIHYRYLEDDQNSLSCNMVRMSVEDSKGNLWIATEGGGLNKLKIKTGEFTAYNRDHGLADNNIMGILIDEAGHLWLSSNNGLSKFNPSSGQIENYTTDDGLQGREFNFGGYYKSSSGELFFSGEKGINYFYPENVKKNLHVPGVVITDFKLFNKSVPIGDYSPKKSSVTRTGSLRLKHDENFISFEFAALNYTSTSKNQYKYMMKGLDRDTVYSGTNRNAEYTDLRPGKYTFWVTGSNNDGVWNPEGISVSLVVRPPWWMSRLAYIVYGILSMLLIALFTRWRTYRLTREKELLEAQVRERTREIEEKDARLMQIDRIKTRFFANISHEFRTPITLIINPAEEMLATGDLSEADTKKLSVIHRNGKRLLDLVTQLLDLSRLDSGKMKIELTEDDIIHFIKLIFSSFISLAEKNGIQYEYHLPAGELITRFDCGKLEIIMNNILSNAFKYTPAGGKIKSAAVISGAEKGDDATVLKISVEDTGPGINDNEIELIFDRFYQAESHRSLNAGGAGIGLSLTRELVRLLKGKIEVKSTPGAGTRFDVALPLGSGHLRDADYTVLNKPEEVRRVPGNPNLSVERLYDKSGAEGIQPVKKTIQVLIAEDNNELRDYLAGQLKADYLVAEAADGEEGLKKAVRIIPDLIISDIRMPKLDGLEFCRRIKTNERTSHIPFIMLTALSGTEDRIEGLETAADDYIIKPFNINELKVRVKNLIEQRQTLRKKFAASFDLSLRNIALNSYDIKFMDRIILIIEDHMDDVDFDVNELHNRSGLSQTQLYRKIFALTGLSPSKFICRLRLKRAAALMEHGGGNITKIALDVGFGSLSYFTRCFREEYGITPSAYLGQVSGSSGGT